MEKSPATSSATSHSVLARMNCDPRGSGSMGGLLFSVPGAIVSPAVGRAPVGKRSTAACGSVEQPSVGRDRLLGIAEGAAEGEGGVALPLQADASLLERAGQRQAAPQP